MAEISGQATISGKSLYDMVHSGPGTWTTDRAHDAAKAHNTTQQEINEEITSIADDLRQAWRGHAAEGAHGATQPLRDGANMSADALRSAQQVHAHQGQHFATIHREMDPLEDGPPETGVWDSITPWDTDTEDAVHRYNTASNRNIELYQAYGKTTDSSMGSMPQRYGVFPQFDGDFAIAEKSAPAGGSTAAASFDGSTPPGSAASPAAGQAAGPGAAVPHGGGQPGTGQPGAWQPVQGSGPSTGAAPGNAPTPNAPAPQGGPAGAPRPGPGGIAPIPAAGGINSGDTVRAQRGGQGSRFSSAGRGGAATGGRFGQGRYDPAGRFGPDGVAEERGRQGTQGTPGAPGREPGGRTGATPGAVAAAEAATAKGATSAARTGTGGAPIAPAGRGRNDEDEVHQRKTVLEEPDAEGVFGTDRPTAPPVIGGSQDD